MRTIIDIPENQLEKLIQFCKREKVSRAEAIRRAIFDYLRIVQTEPDDKVFGLWKGRKIDALNYQKRLRKEWDK